MKPENLTQQDVDNVGKVINYLQQLYIHEFENGERNTTPIEISTIVYELDRKFKAEFKEFIIYLEVGMRVKIKDNPDRYGFVTGTIQTISRRYYSSDYGKVFELGRAEEIWKIKDFEYCVEYPNHIMI